MEEVRKREGEKGKGGRAIKKLLWRSDESAEEEPSDAHVTRWIGRSPSRVGSS